MTDLSIRKKKKITISASSEGIKIAENALIRLGFDSKINFAKSQLLGRSTVTKFFQCESIQLDSFKKICHELKLDWRKIAALPEEQQSQIPGITDCINPDINEGGEKMLTQTFYRQVTVIDKKTNTIKAEIKLIGDLNSFGDSSRVEFILREFAGDTIKITDIKEGSIRLTVEGSQEDIDRLVSLIKSGELKEVSGFPVADVQILSESSEDDESNELNNKWHLVREIVTQGIRDRNLSGVDLSDADLSGANLSFVVDLSGADLSGADLSGANVIRANLSGADLRSADLKSAELMSANLSGADLSGANLFRANLFRANLSGADLSGANLSGAKLSGADLSGADLNSADLSNTNLSGADLSGADLSGADLSGAYLSGAYLIRANLIRANLIRANLSDADLSGADLIRANLIRANLSVANLSVANLSVANLSGANLRSTNLRSANLTGADLRFVNLFGANLTGADLSGANLRSADLSGANLSKTKVEEARFSSNLGISESMKQDLIKQGAIFEDSPGDRSEVLTKA
jgi:uncharacterized protein YjbI with pentapeptide repeats